MISTIRRTAFASLVPTVALASLGLFLAGCTSVLEPRRGLLDDRVGTVPPPYEAPSPGLVPGAAPSPEPQHFPAMLPTGPVVTDEPAFVLEPDLSDPPSPPAPATEVVLPEAPEIERLTHTVARNESLWSIGQKYGVTYQELAAYNQLDADALLPVGKVLRIPPGGRPGAASEGRAPTTRATVAPTPAPASVAGTTTYTVQRGDSISVIAHRSGMTQAELRQLNNLQGDTIRIGQELLVRGEVKPAARRPTPKPAAEPKPEPTPAAPAGAEESDLPELEPVPGPATPAVAPTPPVPAPAPPEPPAADIGLRRLPHDVCKDDTLENIAEMYGTTVQAIQQANPEIKSNADLKVGNTIMVPYR